MSKRSEPVAISVSGLGKRYSKVFDGGFNPFKRRPSPEENHFWALKDLSFQILQGDGVGIIGHNGAGKSTLLKILARIIPPSTGEAAVTGSINSLLEVGTGFQRELSGRSNIYLNASILGMTRSEVNELFDEIVEFSGVGEFIDMPVKNYSSGMYSRLAFAIAAHVTGDILLVDEVLSVGDAQFRKKSLSRMSQMMDAKERTVLFVSHSMDAVMRFCDRTIWLDHGTLRAFGPSDEVIREYLGAIDGGARKVSLPPSPAPSEKSGEKVALLPSAQTDQPIDLKHAGASDTQAGRFIHAHMDDGDGQPKEVFFRDEPIRVHFIIEILESGWNMFAGISVRCAPRKGVYDEVIVFTSFSDSMPLTKGRHTFSASIPKHLFASGRYFVKLSLATYGQQLARHHIIKNALSFTVVDRDSSCDMMVEKLRGVVQPNVLWACDDE